MNTFLRDIPTKILILLRTYKRRRLYKSQIAKRTDSTHPHSDILLGKFKELGLIETEKEGRRVYVTLTKKGELFADNLIKINELK